MRLPLIIAWIVTLIGAFYIGKEIKAYDESFKPLLYEDVIHFENQGPIFMKKYINDYGGNHPVIFLTKDDLRELPNPKKDLIFKNAETIFYKRNKDTIYIYSRLEHKINSDFFKGVNIKVQQLDNPKFMILYDQFHSALKTTDWMN